MINQHELPLAEEIWTTKLENHSRLLGPIANAFLQRRSVHKKHPVHDFLFTYYSYSPTKLQQWVPSIDQKLECSIKTREFYPWLQEKWLCLENGILSLNRNLIANTVTELAKFIAELCKNILAQPPRFGCYGLHEWAMVYKLASESIRHQDYPLRLSRPELDRFVESQSIRCTHYDAYRFFTKDAKGLNVLNPTIDTRLQMEQGGCLHANMDLYKWSTKLWPWIGSDFIAKTFFLSMEGRELDMRASPYDLRSEGYDPICIETEEGRKQYKEAQQILYTKSTLLRQELLNFCKQYFHR